MNERIDMPQEVNTTRYKDRNGTKTEKNNILLSGLKGHGMKNMEGMAENCVENTKESEVGFLVMVISLI